MSFSSIHREYTVTMTTSRIYRNSVVVPYSHLIRSQPTPNSLLFWGGENVLVRQAAISKNIDRLALERTSLPRCKSMWITLERINQLHHNQPAKCIQQVTFIQNLRLQTAWSVSGCSELKYYALLLDRSAAKREHTVHQLYPEPHHQHWSSSFLPEAVSIILRILGKTIKAVIHDV